MYGVRYKNVVCGLFRGAAVAIRKRIKTPFLQKRMELPNTSPQAIKLNPSCSGQVNCNKPGAGPEYENTEPECTFTIPYIPFMICPLRSPDVKSGEFVKRFHATGTNERLDLNLSWQASEDPLRRLFNI